MRRGFTPDEMAALLDLTVPLALHQHRDELAGFLEKVYDEFMGHFCTQVRIFGLAYANSDAYKAFEPEFTRAK